MKKYFIAAAIFNGMITSSLALAAEDCSNPTMSAQIDACARRNKEASEKTLNTAYGEAKIRITSSYRADEKLQKLLQKNLLDAQRGWLKFRENHCKMEAFLADEGTPAYDTLTNRCFSKLNQLRTEQLKEIPYQ